LRRVTMHTWATGVNLGMESDVHWRRTKMSCYRTLILLAFAAVALASLV
jgi:hypothetical protein